jgi:predicted kinase
METAMNAQPERSSLSSIFSRGGLSRAHVERLGGDLATAQSRGTTGGSPTDAVTDILRELRALGQPAAGQFFLNAWLEESGSYDVLPAVRVALAGAGELAGRDLASPRLVITHGLSGAGKTTLATTLAGSLDAVVVRQDTEIARMRRSNGGRSAVLPPGELASRLEALASCTLRAGWAVIVECCFLRCHHRRTFQMLAADHRVPFTILDCRAPLPLIMERLERRLAFGALFGGKDGDLGLVERKLREQLENLEPLDGKELRHAVHVDTGGKVDPERLAARIEKEP